MRRLGLVLALLLLAGCGVLTVNVDVYKGALANHVRVQTEQVAAMSMGAKPILAELRLQLEQAGCKARKAPAPGNVGYGGTFAADRPTDAGACESARSLEKTARAVSDERIFDRDAKRVNAILSLYEDRKTGVTTTLVVPLAETLRTLQVRVEALQAHIQDVVSGSVELDLAFIQRAEAATEEAWTAALGLLIDSGRRARLVALGPEADMLWNVSWTAAQLTSAEGLRLLLHKPKDGAAPFATANNLGELSRLSNQLSQLTEPEKNLKNFDIAAPILSYLTDRLACSEGDPVAGQPKAKKTCPGDGRVLAQELLRAHQLVASARNIYGLKTQDVALAYCLRYTCPADPKSPEEALKAFKEALKKGAKELNLERNISELLRFAGDMLGQKMADAGLELGRPEKGLESLVDQYLKVRAVDPLKFYSEESELERARLLDALINFAEKVLVIANNDALIRGRLQETGLQKELTNVDRYIRVLQAIGNSILSQVDELRHRSSHWSRISRTVAIETSGIRNAEAALPQAVIDQVRQQLKPVLPAAEMTAVEGLLTTANTNLGSVVADLDTRRQGVKTPLDAAKKAADDLRVTKARLIDEGRGEKAIAKLPAAPPVQFGVVSQAIVTQLQTDESEEWAKTPGAPNPAAEALRTAGRTWTSLAADASFQIAGTDSPRSMLGKVLDALRTRADTAIGEEWRLQAKYDALGRSVALVERFTRGSRPPLDIPTEPRSILTAKDVTDVMLASLRYQHIEAVKEYGPDHPRAQNLAAAIELNNAYRSGMVYIRPASAFLRNSYPATVLQNDPVTGAWRNMLTDQALRQLPFYGAAIQDEATRTTEFIDKQFWQSVNQVRVAGAGDTNYVIAKDDVGNWYVKSYASDPKQIFQSARNLALFASGPAGGAALLSRGTPRARALPDAPSIPGADAASQAGAQPPTPPPQAGGQSAATTEQPAKSEPARSALAVQFDQFTQRYEVETRAAHRSLKVAARKLPQRLRDLAVNDATDNQQKSELQSKVFIDGAVPAELKGPTDAKTEDEADKKKDLKTLRDETVTIAQAVATYRANLTKRLDDNKRADNANPDPAAGATPPPKTIWKDVAERTDRLARGEVRSVLERWVRDLETATENYQSVLLIVGNSAGISVSQSR